MTAKHKRYKDLKYGMIEEYISYIYSSYYTHSILKNEFSSPCKIGEYCDITSTHKMFSDTSVPLFLPLTLSPRLGKNSLYALLSVITPWLG